MRKGQKYFLIVVLALGSALIGFYIYAAYEFANTVKEGTIGVLDFISGEEAKGATDTTEITSNSMILPCIPCDIDALVGFEKNLDGLAPAVIDGFLCTFNDTCSTNVEYSEIKNRTSKIGSVLHPKNIVVGYRDQG